MRKLTSKEFLIISLLISLSATLGSLYYSEIVKLVPCDLCWYQRILMYPIPLITIISMIIKDTNVKYYIRILTFLGILTASYQYIIQNLHQKSAFCNITSDCTTIQVQYFGFITLPFMSILAFSLIFICSFFIKRDKMEKKWI
ncbi:disulfide bond formation protein B [Gottfriedia acidiceleris]|uniref:disulfide bond formation protein B n=1 Tax=Gottfriedia acidiceleris TaxID=371036 RepID=UPI000B43CF31|nr:disulfide bond formation protein B [Gottfriedia acidiceleris]